MTDLGGGINRVVRVGRTIRRPTGTWSPAVHELLRHLDKSGFPGAPKFLGIDDVGRETLTAMPGHTPWPPTEQTVDPRLVKSAARLLRRYHDLVADWNPVGLPWQLPPMPLGAAEVICHNDVAAWNVMCENGIAIAFVDWDTAAPGPRTWDLAYLAYTFAPLADAANKQRMGWPVRTPTTQRLVSIAAAYGCDRSQWHTLVDTLAARVYAAYETMRLWAAEDRPGWRAQWEQAEPWRHGAGYLRDVQFIERSVSQWHDLEF